MFRAIKRFYRKKLRRKRPHMKIDLVSKKTVPAPKDNK